MTFDITRWHRFESGGIPVYVCGSGPSWFVPNRAGDRILRGLARGGAPPEGLAGRARFLERLPRVPERPYPGRASVLEPEGLREVWFHLTDRCNTSCRHCLFASSPRGGRELPAGEVLGLAREAADLGARIFALTGGEPTVHPGFAAVVEGLLALPGAHVVILSNGLELRPILRARGWPPERVHLQISLDGLEPRHDAVRGAGAFARLVGELRGIRDLGYGFTLSMCPHRRNLDDMPAVVDLAARTGAAGVHFLWYFARGRGSRQDLVPPGELFPRLVAATDRARAAGLPIDNLEALRAQVFAPAGTIHDGTSAGWESVAVGPDGHLYPSAALVGLAELATDLSPGLRRAWLESPVLRQVRSVTAARSASPFRYILGGGDLDHRYLASGSPEGSDPYEPLLERAALWLIAREASRWPDEGPPALRLKMGDVLEGCGAHRGVAFSRPNCLLALAHGRGQAVVREFYSEAAERPKTDILNPVCYPEELLAHVPEGFRFRGYGCGSPVLDAGLRQGESVADLGCGTGIECFIAARLVGPGGRVVGIDMLEPMLQRARKGARAVRRALGYDNIELRRGELERLPLEDASVDAVISNCVLNLTTHKRRVFAEIFRVLRPGGRLVASDVVCDHEPGPEIRNDEVLRGECIAGALTLRDLVGLLEESGLAWVRIRSRFPYREVGGHRFHSVTFEARRPRRDEAVPVMYRGPLSAALTPGGEVLVPGVVRSLPRSDAEALGDAVFVLDRDGAPLNQEGASPCACAAVPGAGPAPHPPRRSGCMVCGTPLEYLAVEETHTCSYCGQRADANALCGQGHFVCDGCHSGTTAQIIERICRTSPETDMLRLFAAIRSHPAVPVHGPGHHALVPAVILATYRNLGGRVTDEQISAAIRRGTQIAGGACGFSGVCGAASGVGIAFALILGANPVRGPERSRVQGAVQEVLAGIAAYEAARCCQRDGWIALRKASEISARLLDIPLRARAEIPCRQQAANPECLGRSCPLWPASRGRRATGPREASG